MKIKLLTTFLVYILYVIYYNATRDAFLEKWIETTIVFSIVTISIFFFPNIFRKSE